MAGCSEDILPNYRKEHVANSVKHQRLIDLISMHHLKFKTA